MRLQGIFSSIDRINWSVGTTCMFKSTDEKKSRKTNNWGGGVNNNNRLQHFHGILYRSVVEAECMEGLS